MRDLKRSEWLLIQEALEDLGLKHYRADEAVGVAQEAFNLAAEIDTEHGYSTSEVWASIGAEAHAALTAGVNGPVSPEIQEAIAKILALYTSKASG